MIEVITTVAIFAILSVVSVSLFLNTTVGSTKNNSSRQVKQAGEHILSLLETSLRNSSGLTDNSDTPSSAVCQNNMSSLSLVNYETNSVDAWYVENKVLKLNGEAVTGDNLEVLNDRIVVNCSQDQSSGVTFVSISFVLSTGSPSSDKQEEYISQEFETSVTIRNR